MVVTPDYAARGLSLWRRMVGTDAIVPRMLPIEVEEEPTWRQLAQSHSRLDVHFRALAASRGDVGGIYAIEHGLFGDELASLLSLVRRQIAQGTPLRVGWLPFVVYAAEMGYAYTGDEYWPSFERLTPGWSQRDSREDVRIRFGEFARLYGGTVPRGVWASHFGIICWPITHAILPTDLQVAVAELLHRAAPGLTPSLVSEPTELGTWLARLSGGHRTGRMRGLLENPRVLGQIASALLKDEDQSSPLIEPTALSRIVRDLSRTHAAREWLRSARQSAGRVRLRGLSSGSGGVGAAKSRRGTARAAAILGVEPLLSLIPDGHREWRLALDIPDLRPFAGLSPPLLEALTTQRCKINGSSRVLARGQLLYGRQRIFFEDWPQPNCSPITFAGEVDLNPLVAGDWPQLASATQVFKLSADGSARCIRGGVLRPGDTYVLVSDDRQLRESLAGAVEISLLPRGRTGLLLGLPARVSSALVSAIEAAGLTVAELVQVTPAGTVPVAWDGQGRGVWLEGTTPMVRVDTSHGWSICAVRVDDNEDELLAPTEPGQDLLLAFKELSLGVHRVVVELLDDTGNEVRGSMELTIRERHARLTGYSPVIILPDPPFPTFAELWDGAASLDVLGPGGVLVRPGVTLYARGREAPIFERRLSPRPLPVTKRVWRAIAREVRDTPAWADAAERAAMAVVSFAGDELGATRLEVSRAESSIRWRVQQHGRDSRELILVNDTDSSEPIDVVAYPAAAPDRATQLGSSEAPVQTFDPPPGVIRAKWRDVDTAVVYRPCVRSLEDLRALDVMPKFADLRRGRVGLLSLIETAEIWTSAKARGDVLSLRIRKDALGAIAGRCSALICGERWAGAEQASLAEGFPRLDLFRHYVAAGKQVGSLGFDNLLSPVKHGELRDLTPAVRCQRIATWLYEQSPVRIHFADRAEVLELAEAALRVASAPATLRTWAGDRLLPLMDALLDLTVMSRVARFVVLSTVSATDEDDVDAAYGGWSWE